MNAAIYEIYEKQTALKTSSNLRIRIYDFKGSKTIVTFQETGQK